MSNATTAVKAATSYTANNLWYNQAYRWMVIATDSTGAVRTSPTFRFTVGADTIAPTGSFTINNGAVSTANTTVQLTLNATDIGSGVGWYYISNDNKKWYSNSWPTGNPASITVNWDMTQFAYGGSPDPLSNRTVYVKFHDMVQKASPVYQQSIAINLPGALVDYLRVDAAGYPIDATKAKTGSTISVVYNILNYAVSGDTANIEYTINNGVTWQPIAMNTAITNISNSTQWLIPTTIPVNSVMQVRVTPMRAGVAGTSKVSKPFTIISGALPTATVTAPIAGASVMLGGTLPISWTTNLTVANTSRIEADFVFSNGGLWNNQRAIMNQAGTSSNLVGVNTANYVVPINNGLVGQAKVRLTVMDSNFNTTVVYSPVFNIIALQTNNQYWNGAKTIALPAYNFPVGSRFAMSNTTHNLVEGEDGTTYMFLTRSYLYYPASTQPQVIVRGEELYRATFAANIWSSPVLLKSGSIPGVVDNNHATSSTSRVVFDDIVVDAAGKTHFTWSSSSKSGLDQEGSEVYYQSYDGITWSAVTNISNSSLTPTITMTQTPSTGVASFSPLVNNVAVLNSIVYNNRTWFNPINGATGSMPQLLGFESFGSGTAGYEVIGNTLYFTSSTGKMYSFNGVAYALLNTIAPTGFNSINSWMAAATNDGSNYYRFDVTGTVGILNKFNPATNTWITMGTLTGITGIGTIAATYYPINNSIVITGIQSSNIPNNRTFGGAIIEFDLGTNNWKRTIPDLVGSSNLHLQELENYAGNLFAFATVDETLTGQANEHLLTIYQLDRFTSSWVEIASFKTIYASGFGTTVDANGKVYLVGGRSSGFDGGVTLQSYITANLPATAIGVRYASSNSKVITDTTGIHIVWQDGMRPHNQFIVDPAVDIWAWGNASYAPNGWPIPTLLMATLGINGSVGVSSQLATSFWQNKFSIEKQQTPIQGKYTHAIVLRGSTWPPFIDVYALDITNKVLVSVGQLNSTNFQAAGITVNQLEPQWSSVDTYANKTWIAFSVPSSGTFLYNLTDAQPIDILSTPAASAGQNYHVGQLHFDNNGDFFIIVDGGSWPVTGKLQAGYFARAGDGLGGFATNSSWSNFRPAFDPSIGAGSARAVLTPNFDLILGNGAEATDSTNIAAVNLLQPKITLVQPKLPNIEATRASTVLTVAQLGTATATDSAGNALVAAPQLNPAGYPLGAHTITWSATDAAGVSVSATQNITIVDTTAPKLPVILAATVRSTTGTYQPTLADLGGAVTATDTVDGNVIAQPQLNPAGYTLGVHTIDWYATDKSSLIGKGTQTLTVLDGLAPELILAQPTITVTATGLLTPVALGTYTVADNLDPVASLIPTNNAPAVGYAVGGPYVVRWSLTDAAQNTTSVDQYVTVVNNAPIVYDQTIITRQATAATQLVVAFDPDQQALGYAITVAPKNGAASIDANGKVSYTPNAAFSGGDSLTVTVTDVAGATAQAVVTISVIKVNHPPVPTIATMGNVVSGATGTAQVTHGDPDVGDTHAYSVTAALNGTATISATGLLSYTPNGTFVGNESLTIIVTDNAGLTGQVNAVVTAVAPPNQPPKAANDVFTFHTLAGTSFSTGDVRSNDFDPNKDPLSVIGQTQPVNGSVALAGNGVFTYTPKPRFAGVDSFNYTISDGKGGTATATVRITLIDNTKPNVTVPANITVAAVNANGTSATQAAIVAFLGGATASDNIAVVGGVTNNAPAIFSLGATPVAFTALDAANNNGTIRATVTVTDQTAPVISLLGKSPYTVAIGSTYIDAGATASDNVDGNLTASIVANKQINTSTLGTYTVTYNVSDAAKNAALQVTRTVNVIAAPTPTAGASIIRIADVYAAPGSTINVPIVIEPYTGVSVSALSINIQFDGTYLTAGTPITAALPASWGCTYPASPPQPAGSPKIIQIRCITLIPSDYMATAISLQLPITIKATAPLQAKFTLTVSPISMLYDGNNAPLSSTLSSGSLTINQASVTYNLAPGWNLISFPIDLGATGLNDFLTAVPNVIEMWALRNGAWSSYDRSLPRAIAYKIPLTLCLYFLYASP